MSKKNETRQKAAFTLEPDGFSVHTMELTAQLTRREFRTVKAYLYEQKRDAIYEDKSWNKNGKRYSCSLYQAHGIRLFLLKNRHEEFEKYILRLIVNPRKLIEPDCSYLGILPPMKSSILEFSQAFQKLFDNTPIPSYLNFYRLTRIDCCTNIRCDKKAPFRELIRVLRKLPAPPKYERRYYTHSDKKKANQYNKHYIRFACGSQELVIYDKTYQVSENDLIIDYESLPKGIIRFEVQQSRTSIHKVEKTMDVPTTEKLIWYFTKHSGEIIPGAFSRCFADTSFFHIDKLEDVIRKSRFNAEKKEAMLALVSLLQRKQSVDKALKALEKTGVDTTGLLDHFKRLGINPIPLRQNFRVQNLPSPVTLLRTVGLQDVLVEYWETKYR